LWSQPQPSHPCREIIDDPHFDPELKKYGGRFDKKVAIGQVTFRFPIEWRLLSMVALLYGFLPWLVPFGFFVGWVSTRHFILIYGLIVSLVTSGVNEVGLKPLCNDPRPIESANREADGTLKPGMPSGHVLNAIAIMVWSLLEVLLRGPDEPGLEMEWIIFIVVMMGPVPWARIYNKDHTLTQCVVAGALGVFVGYFAYCLRVLVFPHHWQPWDSAAEAPSSMFNRSSSFGIDA
jgi:hypothetical protein